MLEVESWRPQHIQKIHLRNFLAILKYFLYPFNRINNCTHCMAESIFFVSVNIIHMDFNSTLHCQKKF